jgi:acylphosphatase
MVDQARLSVSVAGRVQGVGFRYWVREQARALGLRGSAVNLADGRVEIVVEGSRAACQALLEALGSDATPGVVTGITPTWSTELEERDGFRVR